MALFVAVALDAVARAGAVLLTRRRNGANAGRVTAACGFALVVVLLVLHWPSQLAERTSDSRNDDQTAAAQLIGAHAQLGDAVVFVPGAKRGVEYVYQQDFSQVTDVLQIETPMAAGSLGGREADPDDVRRLLAGHDRLWVIDRSGLIPDTSPIGKAKAQVLRDDYRVSWTQSVTGLEVTLYIRKQ